MADSDAELSPLNSAGRRMISAPKARLVSAILGQSVETYVFSKLGVRAAASRIHPMSGLPRNGTRFLSGIPFEPPRAGMIATADICVFKITNRYSVALERAFHGSLTLPGSNTENIRRYRDTSLDHEKQFQ